MQRYIVTTVAKHSLFVSTEPALCPNHQLQRATGARAPIGSVTSAHWSVAKFDLPERTVAVEPEA